MCRYLRQLLFISAVTVFFFSLVCIAAEQKDVGDKPKEKVDTPKEVLNKAITATFESAGFHFKGKGYFKVTAPKTNILIQSEFAGVTKNPDLTHMTLESEETGEKMEIYRQGENTAVKTNKKKGWTRQNIASPVKFMEFYKDTLDDIKLSKEEKVDDKPCQVIEATFNQDGINNLLALYKIAVLPNAQKASSVKIWAGKENNLIYKITTMLEINAESLPNPLDEDEDEENLPPDKRKPKKTNVKFNAEVVCFDYNKDIDIKIPGEAKKILEKKGNKK